MKDRGAMIKDRGMEMEADRGSRYGDLKMIEDQGEEIEDRGAVIEDRGAVIEDRGEEIEDRVAVIEDREIC